ncbi:MAG: FAD-dependent oxidoreductase [Candidatus Heimdallarchaeota archaeon]
MAAKKIGSVLVIGGGIAGIQTSLDLADSGFKVYLVEQAPSIGGTMAQLDKTLPTNDCSICIQAPKMVEVGRHSNIELLAYSEVKLVEGEVGNFTVTLLRKARFVDETKCKNCGACAAKCPRKKIPSEFDLGLANRTAAYVPFPQAVPPVYLIDKKNCIYFETGKCRACEKACPADAINFKQEDREVTINVGAIIVATGFEEFDPSAKGEFGFGAYKNVVTSLQFERLLSASGPTGGQVLRPSDGTVPQKIAWIQCVGSRDLSIGNPWCSRVCCMWTTKQAMIAMEHHHEITPFVFYMDIRAYGKGFEEYYRRGKDQFGVNYIKSRPSHIDELENGNLVVVFEDLSQGRVDELEVDMVVLSSAIVPSRDNEELAQILGIDLDSYGFFKAQDPLAAPLETNIEGIYLCGCATGPRDIPDSVAQASGAAAKAAAVIHELRGVEVTEVELPPAKEVRPEDAPRIGVFVCHCGINIGGFLDVPTVCEYAKTLEHVVYANHLLFACSEDSQTLIKEVIEQYDLNRVVVASCTPRTHEPLFRTTCRQAGLNEYLFEMANIRDQCSWVHSADREGATKKAKQLVAMAVAKARLLTPGEETRIPVKGESLVIGGGIAGMTSAAALAEMGFKVYLVEQEYELGGMLRKLGRLYPTDEDAGKIIANQINRIQGNENITIYTGTTVESVSGYIGSFDVRLLIGDTEHTINVGTIIIATGAKEIDPTGFYSFGEYDNVITQLQLERMLKEKSLKTNLKNLVMINCVGSKEEAGEGARTYCCRVGCGTSLKNAKQVKEQLPDANVYILHEDMRIVEKTAEEYYGKVRSHEGVYFVHYPREQKPSIVARDGTLVVQVHNTLLGESQEITADYVVLTTATETLESEKLSKMLKIPIGTGGFFQEAHVKLRPMDFATDGIFVCGSAHSPKGVSDTISQALGAVARASIPMGRGYVMTQAITAQVDSNLCRGCGICEKICEYGAVGLIEQEAGYVMAEVNPVLCKGCGACSVACPSRAITPLHFTTDQIRAMLKPALM